jgi:hypothetical protein
MAMVVSPVGPQPRERALNALAECGPGKIGAFAPGVREKRRGVLGRQLRDRRIESADEVFAHRRLLGRRRSVGPIDARLFRVFPPPAGFRPDSPDLPTRDAQNPGERVPRRVELARAKEHAQQRFLRGVVRLREGKAPGRETAHERPEALEQGVERGAIPPRQPGEKLLDLRADRRFAPTQPFTPSHPA